MMVTAISMRQGHQGPKKYHLCAKLLLPNNHALSRPKSGKPFRRAGVKRKIKKMEWSIKMAIRMISSLVFLLIYSLRQVGSKI